MSALFACIRICMSLFNPHWQLDTHTPLPYSLIDGRTFVVVFSVFPYQNDRFLHFFPKTFSAVIAGICISAFGQPSLTTWHPYPSSPRVPYSLIDAGTFVGFSFFSLSKRSIFCIFFLKIISALFACIRIDLYVFVQPSLTTWHSYPPLAYSLIEDRTFVGFSFFSLSKR